VSLIDNEQAKLAATYFNGIAIALAAVGGIAPWIAFLVQGSDPGAVKLVAISVLCISLSVGLHYLGRRALKRLKE
jgi:NO-binding membrane sensor protein with MHYT domain